MPLYPPNVIIPESADTDAYFRVDHRCEGFQVFVGLDNQRYCRLKSANKIVHGHESGNARNEEDGEYTSSYVYTYNSPPPPPFIPMAQTCEGTTTPGANCSSNHST